MGRLDMDIFNFLGKDEMRVLTAVEMGMKNHELVPSSLIKAISALSVTNAGLNKILRELSDKRLITRERAGRGDFGYKLLVSGYDFLALKALVKQNHVSGFGNQIGVGKESDVYTGIDENSVEVCIKLHRLGRTSFRQVKNKRDYLRHRQHASWLYVSRLSAETEIIIMNALFKEGFPVPKPIAQNRHIVIMEYIQDSVPLYQVKELDDPRSTYQQIISILKRLLECGLVHGDFNEFNLLIAPSEEDEVTKEVVRVIDFPQMVSRNHRNAKFYYNRDAKCIQSFFEKKFNIVSTVDNDVPPIADFDDVPRTSFLDIELKLSGYQNDPNHTGALCEGESDEEDIGEGSGEEEGAEGDEDETGDDAAVGRSESDDEDSDDESNSASQSSEEDSQSMGAHGAAQSDIKTAIGNRSRRRRQRRQKNEKIPAEEIRQRVKREAMKERRRHTNNLAKKQMRADRNAAAGRSMKEELIFGGDL